MSPCQLLRWSAPKAERDSGSSLHERAARCRAVAVDVMQELRVREEIDRADGVVVVEARRNPVTPGCGIGIGLLRCKNAAGRAFKRLVRHSVHMHQRRLHQENRTVGTQHGTEHLRAGRLDLAHVVPDIAPDLFRFIGGDERLLVGG